MVDFQSRDTGRDRDAGTVSSGSEPGADSDEEESAEAAVETGVEERGVAVATVGDVGEAVTPTAVEQLEAVGLTVVTREGLAAEHDGVQSAVDALVSREDVLAVVVAGGVDVGPGQVTVDAVDPLLDTALPGFGELFRLLHHEQVGTDIVSTRATAGLAEETPVFCLPGTVQAVQLGVGDIVVEQAERLAGAVDAD